MLRPILKLFIQRFLFPNTYTCTCIYIHWWQKPKLAQTPTLTYFCKWNKPLWLNILVSRQWETGLIILSQGCDLMFEQGIGCGEVGRGLHIVNSTCTGCSLNIEFFLKIFLIFLNSASSAAALVLYLPSGSQSMKSGVHTEEKPREAWIRNIFWNCWKKHTIINEHPVYVGYSEEIERQAVRAYLYKKDTMII